VDTLIAFGSQKFEEGLAGRRIGVLAAYDLEWPSFEIELAQDLQLAAFRIDGKEVRVARGTVFSEEIIETDGRDIIGDALFSIFSMHVSVGEPGNGGEYPVAGLAEGNRLARLTPDAAYIDRTASVRAKFRSIGSSWLGKDTPPAKLLLEQPSVTKSDTLSGPELNEKAPLFEIKEAQSEEILAKLGL
jgi:hypothetical protein